MVRVPAEEYGSKFRTKQECYHFVAHEYGAYLPPHDTVTWMHLRALQAGKKKIILGREIKYLHVPQYENLNIKEFLKFADDYPFIMMHLPDRKVEIDKLPRQYIINRIFTKVGEKFSTWVNEKVNQRHEKVKDEGKQYIELDPEIAKVYQQSKAISTSNGKTYQLLKSSAKPRRTKAEIAEAKLREAEKQMEIEMKLKKLEEMEQSFPNYQQQMENLKAFDENVELLCQRDFLKK